MENRSFVRSEKNLYSNEEKLELAELVERLKRDYDNEEELNAGKTRYYSKRKKHVPVIQQGGFVAKAVIIFYTGLSDIQNDDPQFRAALCVANCAHKELEKLRDPSVCPAKRFRASGAGRKQKAPEVRQALFAWFIDVREALKGRLPKRLFKMKAGELYAE